MSDGGIRAWQLVWPWCCVCVWLALRIRKNMSLCLRGFMFVVNVFCIFFRSKQLAGATRHRHTHQKKNHMRRIRANIGAFRYEIYVLHSTITKIKYLISIFCVIRSAHCLRATRQTANNHICETHCASNGYFYSTLHATIYKEFVKCDWGLLVCLITMWTFAEKELNLD